MVTQLNKSIGQTTVQYSVDMVLIKAPLVALSDIGWGKDLGALAPLICLAQGFLDPLFNE